jgi:hypothetical protein
MVRHSSLVCALLSLAAARSPGNAVTGPARGTLMGIVTDAATGTPLGNTNVYLSSTMIGTTTGPDGTFTLSNIPSGVFLAVASRVGHRVQSHVVQVSQTDTVRSNFALEPVALQGEEVDVVAHPDREWRRLLGKFTASFIGEGRNAEECSILNPEVLDFRMEKGTGMLTASTDSVLRIENRAFGYRLYARLGFFTWDLDEDRGKFVLYPRFESLGPNDTARSAEWQSNRERSYRGSLKHFLSSLVAGTLGQEGFIVDAGSLTDLVTGTERPLRPEDFTLEPVRGEQLWMLTFDRWLRVEYRGERGRRKSFITLTCNSAVLDNNGNLADPLCVQVAGDWTKYRVADMLPID